VRPARAKGGGKHLVLPPGGEAACEPGLVASRRRWALPPAVRQRGRPAALVLGQPERSEKLLHLLVVALVVCAACSQQVEAVLNREHAVHHPAGIAVTHEELSAGVALVLDVALDKQSRLAGLQLD